MRKQVAVVILLMLAFAGAGSSAIVSRALARSAALTAVQQEKQLGPKPTPSWYWRWAEWRLGEGYARGHQLQRDFRPNGVPRRIPAWAWQRLHFYLLARVEGAPAAGRRKHGWPPPTTTTTTATTTGTTTTGTTTTGTTTTGTTTTGTTTTTPSGGETYDQAISYTQTRPSFTPSRTVDVGSASQFQAALSNLQPGDLVKATSAFTVSGETVISNQLSSFAVLDLGSNVTFDYSGGSNFPAVWLKNPSYLRIYGGILTTEDTGGNCILSQGMQHVLWWGFVCHDSGNTGVAMYPVLAPITDSDFQGEIYKAGENLAWDPHAEKGSGLHGANLDDCGTNVFANNRFAFYIHDQPSGAGIEYGSNGIPPVNNTIYEKATNLTFVSQTQTGGNAIQFWGVAGQSADIQYLEADNVQGYGVFDGGMYSGATLSNVTVDYGVASNTNLNPRYAGYNPWQSDKGIGYQQVTPTS